MTETARPAWIGIEVRHMMALEAAAREGSFRGAADSLGYVQSAISQQVAHLERVVGAELVERRRGVSPVTVTEAGELLLGHFGEILAHLTAAQADLDALNDGRTGRLRIGLDESVATRLMPAILPALSERLPGLEVEMEESRFGDELADLVTAGELDLAFAELPLPTGPFGLRELVLDPYVLLVPASWDLGKADRPPRPDELSGIPLIGSDRQPQAQVVDSALRAYGAEPRYVLRSGIGTVIQALVAAGTGAAIMPRLAVNLADERTSALELTGMVSPRTVVLYWHRDRERPRAFDAFVEIAAAVAADHERSAPVQAT